MGETPSRDDIGRLAFAVAKPGVNALLIGFDNKPTGPGGTPEFVPISQAVDEHRTFAVEPRDGLLCLDVDGLEHHVWADRVAQQVRARGCATVRAASGRPDHAHLWINAPVGWSMEDLRTLVLDCGAPSSQKRTNATRPPLSRHRLGGYGQLLDPSSVDEAVRRLAQRPLLLDLPEKAVRLLRNGDVDGHYRDRRGRLSREYMIQALISWWIQADLSFDSLLSEMRNPVNVAGVKVREKGTDNGRDWLLRKWDEVRTFVRDNPRRPSSELEAERLQAVLRTVDVGAWAGRTGSTDRAVYAALAGICAEHLGRPVVRASHRRLAELTGYTRKTVSRSLDRLRKAGLLTVDVEPVGLAATGWRLHPETQAYDPSKYSLLRGDREVTTGVNRVTFTGSRPDAFRTRHGLTAGAWQTFITMPAGTWIKTSQLRDLRPQGPTLATLRTHLVRLHSAGFVDRDLSHKQSWKRSVQANFERYAHFMGTAGATERQREHNEAEREAWSCRSGLQRPA